jgi:acyl dehydratase
VKSGARIRGRVTMLSVERKEAGRTLVKWRHTVEIEGSERPALVAEVLSLMVAAETP